ncbi:MAG TPA: amidase [Gemmatimonadaceae bacterium]|nr:amidase [Gemmatimonadaceae bacterium]
MSATSPVDRRRFMATCSSLGLGSTLLPGVLWSQLARGAEITKETIACAEQISGVTFTDEQRTMMVDALRRQQRSIEALHKIPLDNAVAPALVFDPVPPGVTLVPPPDGPTIRSRVAVREVPGSDVELAYMPVSALAPLVRARKVTSRRLTELYLSRLAKHDPTLHAVVSMTTERARTQARAMDEELARGKYRGPLHGIPWGAKDLLATKGYKTTWGAGPYRDQVIDADAEVVKRLDAAGAVLVAKLTLGELAQGDRWFGERTRNPWWPEQGSSGSSAGPGSAVAAGLVGFAIGTETLGSISSPSTRNGVTGLRPSFGRVPRTGAMALSWTMDKIGPMCRSAEDCALVFDAIIGPDGYDRDVKRLPFRWDATLDPTRLRVGYLKSSFEAPERDPQNAQRTLHATRAQDDAALAALRRLGVTLLPAELPPIDTQAMSIILTSEAGAAFEELTLSGRVNQMVQQGPFDWPNTFRAAQFIPAVDYVNANRARMLALRAWWDFFRELDVLVTPTSVANNNQLQLTNLTGTPAVIVPNGFMQAPPLQPPAPTAAPADTGRRPPTGSGQAVQPPTAAPRPQVPVSLTFLGPLYREDLVLAMAHHYQRVTDWHQKRPPGFD